MHTSTRLYLTTLLALAAGTLIGCQYCEPLLLASLMIAAFTKSLRFKDFITIQNHH